MIACLPDLSQPVWFLAAALLVFAVVVARYFILSGFFFLFFHRWYARHWQPARVSGRAYPAGQFRTEIGRSILSAAIFGVSGAFLGWCWQQGYALLYESPADYGWWWLPMSLLLALFAQETYYYWMHRWMHIPAVYKWVHRWHHDSHIASPWTSFSFHPAEAFIQALFLPLLLLVLPLNVWVLLAWLVIMSVSSVVNHLDVEIYPAWFARVPFLRGLIGATHHAMHHKQFRYNYGLYVNWWDKWLGTESPSYEELFRQKSTARKP